MTTQVNLSMVPRANVVESTMTSRLIDFVRMNPPIFLVSNVGDDPQEFIDKVYKIVHAMGVTYRESGVGFISIEICGASVVHTMERQ